ARRNLDDPELGAALGRTYQQMDPKFPTVSQSDRTPLPPRSGSIFVKSAATEDEPPAQLSVSIDHLSARYYDVTFESDVDQVTWDVSGIQPNDHIHADLVLLPL